MWTIATFNANGVRARLPLIRDWLQQHRPQVLCLQETKVQDADFPAAAFQELGYQVVFHGQKAYNGVAIASRSEPAEVRKGLDDGVEDDQARFLAARIDGLWVVNTYVPQGRDPDDPAFAYKLEFFERLHRWFQRHHRPQDPLLWVGDLNVAPEPIDVFDPQHLEGQVGFHPAERRALARVVSWGFVDLFRRHHPDRRQFTFWDYRLPRSFPRGLGWRLDHILATEPLARRCRDCWVDEAPRGAPRPSDHTFVLAELDWP